MKLYLREHKLRVGELVLGVYNNALCLCDWKYRKARIAIHKRIIDSLQPENIVYDQEHPLLSRATAQLDEYISGKKIDFDIPLMPVGSNFQKQVWELLLQIPFGETRSYLDLARDLGDKNLTRAVASANGANAISIFIPCHRVIGSDGSLTGYAGGLNTKKNLLALEYTGVKQLNLFER